MHCYGKEYQRYQCGNWRPSQAAKDGQETNPRGIWEAVRLHGKFHPRGGAWPVRAILGIHPAFAVALGVSTDMILFGEVNNEYGFVTEKLKEVPADKLPHVLTIINGLPQ